jgi:hypothetical protein
MGDDRVQIARVSLCIASLHSFCTRSISAYGIDYHVDCVCYVTQSSRSRSIRKSSSPMLLPDERESHRPFKTRWCSMLWRIGGRGK